MSFGSWRSSASSSNPRLAGLSRPSGVSSRVSSPSSASSFSGSTLSRSLTQLPFGSGSSSLSPSSVDQFITTANSYTPSNATHHRRSPFLKRSSGQSGVSGGSGGSGVNSWSRASSISNLSSNPYSNQVYSVLQSLIINFLTFVTNCVLFWFRVESKPAPFSYHSEASVCGVLVHIAKLFQISNQ